VRLSPQRWLSYSRLRAGARSRSGPRQGPSVSGETLTKVPINPVHVALMNNGKVLIVAGSDNVATETNFEAAVRDPASETFQTQPVA